MGIEAQARRLHSANASQIKSVNACSLTTVPSRVGGSSYRRRTLWLRQKYATSWLTQDSACAYLSGARQIGATDNLLPKTQKVC